MTTVVLSIGSNLGDRLARLQSVVDALSAAAVAVSPVFESDPWGGVEQDAFLNAVVVADDPARGARDWLTWAQGLERQNQRVREIHWGPRTLDVDLVCCCDGDREIRSDTDDLTLPHPQAHRRAFVLIPWLAADPSAQLHLGGRRRAVSDVLAELDDAERSSVRATDLSLHRGRR